MANKALLEAPREDLVYSPVTGVNERRPHVLPGTGANESVLPVTGVNEIVEHHVFDGQ